jgi:hypothetical protein
MRWYKNVLHLALIFIPLAVHAQTWTYEQHGDTLYGYGPHGERSTQEEHAGVTYGRDNKGHEWTTETHAGVTYVRPR